MRLGGGQFRLGLQAAIAPNVIDRAAAFAEHPAHEQPAMTSGGVLLGAQGGHDVLPQALLQAGQALPEIGGLDYLVVQDMASGSVVDVAARPAAKLTAEVDVLESGRAQGFDERFAIEVGGVLGIRAERTSATTCTECSASSSRNFSMEWLEWPMVRTRGVSGTTS